MKWARCGPGLACDQARRTDGNGNREPLQSGHFYVDGTVRLWLRTTVRETDPGKNGRIGRAGYRAQRKPMRMAAALARAQTG